LYCFDTLGLPSTASTILLKIVIQPAYLDLKEYDFLAVQCKDKQQTNRQRATATQMDRWTDRQTSGWVNGRIERKHLGPVS